MLTDALALKFQASHLECELSSLCLLQSLPLNEFDKHPKKVQGHHSHSEVAHQNANKCIVEVGELYHLMVIDSYMHHLL